MSSSSSGTALTSPGGRSPCTRGKTVRDFEEELSELKRENFDLKMRIYIMEEQQEFFQGVENINEIYEVNKTLKKEVESLRKDVSEKDDLILKAGDAMNMLVNKHKEEVGLLRVQAQKEIEQYRDKLEIMQQELMEVREKLVFNANTKLEDSSVLFTLPYTLPGDKNTFEITKHEEIVVGFTTQISELENELKDKYRKLEESSRIIEKLKGEIKSLKETENSLRSEIVSKGGEISVLQNELAERDIEIQALQKQIKSLTVELSNESKISESAQSNQANKDEQFLSEELHKMQLEKEQNNYQKLKAKYDSVRQENDQLSNQVVELHKRLNDLQVELQHKGSINMDLQHQLESLKEKHNEMEEEARSLRIKSAADNEIPVQITRKLADINARYQDVTKKLRDKEHELKQAKNEQYETACLAQKLMKHNKSLTKDIENFKVLLEKKEQHHANVEMARGEQYKAKYEEVSSRMAEVEKERDMLQVVMEQQVQKLLHAAREKDNLIKGYQSEGQMSSDKEVRIEELERQIASLKMEIGTELGGGDFEKKNLYQELEEKKKEIEHLNEELRKRTFNLQELVNKELWDKNREIEKLNKVCEKKQMEVTNLRNQMQRQEEELLLLNTKLQELSDHITQNISKISEGKDEPVSFREKYLAEVEEKNALVKQVENLKSQLDEEVIKNGEQLKECNRWREEAEQLDKSRKDLFNACTLLMTRLEELASFLDSLLPLLGAKKRRLLQLVIDRSRETSRTLSISFLDQTKVSDSNLSVTPILPDFSQVDFFSEDESLDITLVQKNDVEDQNAEVAQIREQVESMVEKLKEVCLNPDKKNEQKCSTVLPLGPQAIYKSQATHECLALEDITEGSLLESFESDVKEESRHSLPSMGTAKQLPSNRGVSATVFDKQDKSAACSESEGWSEPDRNVSLARIGIKEDVNVVLSSDESSDSLPKPSLPSKKRQEEIRRLNTKIKHLEKLNRSLMAEIRLREKAITPACHSRNTSEIHGENLMTKTLLSEINKLKEKLQASMAQNEFLRNQLEGTSTNSVGEVESKRNLVSQLNEMSTELERSCILCIELERRYTLLELERTALKDAAENLKSETITLKATIKEKENEALEAQCSLLDLRNKFIVMENAVNIAENRAEEAAAKIIQLENKIAELDNLLKETKESWSKAAAEWEQEKLLLIEAHEKEVNDLEASATKMKTEFENASREQRLSIERVHEQLQDILLKRSLADNEWKQRLDTLEKEKKQELNDEIEKRMILERKLVVSYEKQSELRSRLEAEMSKTREIETNHKTVEKWWRRRLEEAEGARAEREAELRRRLDAAALTTSEAVLDRTRLANDRLRLQAELRRRDDIAHEVKTELERRVAELEAANKELEYKMASLHSRHISSDTEVQYPSSPKSPPFLLNRQRSNPTSDYTSDPEHHGSNGNLWFPVCGRSNNNASPDLGIESDQGRLSSLDALPPTSPKTTQIGEIGKLELENSELRAQLERTRKALEETYAQLNTANHRKRQVERAICRQLSKTHHILQKARTNLESSDHAAQL